MASEIPDQITLELALDEPDDPKSLREKIARQLGAAPTEIPPPHIRKRSLDCRRGRVRFHILCELATGEQPLAPLALPHPIEVTKPARVVVIGDGPCGMFCAYQLARHGIACTVLDRGKRVQPRRRDLRGLTKLSTVNPDSNYCFGEGGAGTYSDGKLYTRSHKRGDVRDVIEILALHGAPPSILVEARPHIGSNLLPRVVTALRERLESVGVEFRFEARATNILRNNQTKPRVRAVQLQDGEEIPADAVVLATGHSARDVFSLLHAAGHPLEAKAFALGVRIEHPQDVINRIQYGSHAGHPKLPSAAYRLVDSRSSRAVFSFCMCPGGFIVPASTSPGEVVVNGMSPSRRNSRYANSGIVVGVDPGTLNQAGYVGPLAGIELQRQIERAAFEAGGATLAAPATRLTDFLAGRGSSSVPRSSYVPGLSAGDVAAVLDTTGIAFSKPLRAGLGHFGKRLRGYLSEEAVLVGVESRTSSPVRIPRNPETLMSEHWLGLYPGGEGAGYAGGIMSAAVDGMRIAREIARTLSS